MREYLRPKMKRGGTDLFVAIKDNRNGSFFRGRLVRPFFSAEN